MYVTMIIAYSITSRTEGLANKSIEVVLVRRNVGAPIRIESSRDVTVIIDSNSYREEPGA